MTKYSISFVLPMYNESKNIEDTLRKISRLARELSDDYEIIVSDDASTDTGAAIVCDIASRDNRHAGFSHRLFCERFVSHGRDHLRFRTDKLESGR